MNSRQFKQRLKTLMKKHHGRCSCCRKPYLESCHTFYGVDYEGKLQQVSDCCKNKLEQLSGGGVYMAVDANTPEGATIQEKLLRTHPLRRDFR